MTEELGGLPRIILRFFAHYESFTPVGLRRQAKTAGGPGSWGRSQSLQLGVP